MHAGALVSDAVAYWCLILALRLDFTRYVER